MVVRARHRRKFERSLLSRARPLGIRALSRSLRCSTPLRPLFFARSLTFKKERRFVIFPNGGNRQCMWHAGGFCAVGGQISSESCITGRARSKNHDSRMSAHFRHKERGAAFGVGLSQTRAISAHFGQSGIVDQRDDPDGPRASLGG